MSDLLEQLWTILRYLLPAVPRTIEVTLVSFVLALVLGLAVGLLRIQRRAPWNWLARAYVDGVRGVPLLVIIFFVYFGLGRVLSLPQFVAGVVAIGLCYSAYVGETLRAGIEAIPKGQWEAARSLGMSWTQTMRWVVLPQAFRVVIPPLMNELISCLKDSSLVSIIGLRELTRAGREYSSGTFVDFQTWLVVGLLYLSMTAVLTRLSARLESRLQGATR
ncbi:MAG: amino acid ABC transporter permease [Candidatus Eisenbacteria bacterium]|uniref:Amino acid ABC transporter permease n=1 Tax=Eiseniibacteriota bacterium TaxID=2212470 RepID=A0A956M2B3_UNCEI|nr:amino acid ABC transporter permease [Candidatus Eisenbacteria bacterium]